jgi:hypothetical protein
MFDLQFRIFDAAVGGTVLGTIQVSNVAVAKSGDYTASLDFGAAVFDGNARYLEVGFKPAGTGGAFTPTSPRDNVTIPYAIRSLSSATAASATNAANLGGVPANQFVQTSDPRLSDARTPLPGSSSYIQNTTSQQASSNFNISGNGSANTFTAATQYNIGSNRVVSIAGQGNVFIGSGTGPVNTGDLNTFVGEIAGLTNTSGRANTFLGGRAGRFNTTGFQNTYVGAAAGASNMTGTNNALFGADAGSFSTSSNNAMFGSFVGTQTKTGGNNSFFGFFSGFSNDSGGSNAFFGAGSGTSNVTGSANTAVGANSNVGSSGLSNATAIGASALVSQSDSMVLGSISGVNGAASDTNVGIGTTTPSDRLDVVGMLRVSDLGFGGDEALCRNLLNQISSCSSSLRYKTNIAPYSAGMSFVRQLQPIIFDWKQGGRKDVGFGAEDVARIDPRFVTYNQKGEVEGVKYDRIGVVLINAVKEQQAQIETLQKTVDHQREQIEQQRHAMDELRKLVCAKNARAPACKQKARTIFD